ncbi:unnamed protein product [Rhizopus microsporus]
MTKSSTFAASSISQHQVNTTMTSTTVPATNPMSIGSIMSTDDILSESASFEATSLSNVPVVGSIPIAMTLSDLCHKSRALILQLSALIASLTHRLHTVAIGSDLEQTLTKELQAHKEHLQMFKNTIDMFSAYDVTATTTIMPTTLSHPYVVSDNLPMMQWRGSVFDRRSPVAGDIRAYLKRFEDALSSHGLDYNRIFDSLDELLTITMGPNESVEQYVYRFKILSYFSDVKEPVALFVCFMAGLSADLHRAVSLDLLMASEGERYSVDYAISLAEKTNNKAFSSSCSVKKRRFIPCAVPDRSQPYKKPSNNRYCSFHKNHSHSDAQCCTFKKSKITGDKLPSPSSGMTRSSWDPSDTGARWSRYANNTQAAKPWQ